MYSKRITIPRGIARVCGALSVTALVAAAWFSVLLARADSAFRLGTPEGEARAAALLPRATAYLSLVALQIEYDGGDPRPLLEKIVALTPFASAPRIRLGLDAEARGDNATAEKWLLEAAHVDRQFEPAWTLANFYFRTQNMDDFWKWMRTALDVSYGDRTPAFDLCWQASSSAHEILTRAIPDRREVVAAYVSYLLAQRKLAAAPEAAEKLAHWRDTPDADGDALLDRTADALLDSGEYQSAMSVWAAAGNREQGSFASAHVGHGFDWRFIDAPGVRHVALDSQQAHRIVLDGQEPESVELLRRYVRLAAGAKTVLSWEARTSGFRTATGLEWRLGDFAAPVTASEDWRAGNAAIPAGGEWPILTLHYQRPVGETRADGYVEIRNVRINVRIGDPGTLPR
jgi:tetratricopeptide (TPR) repeat protein